MATDDDDKWPRLVAKLIADTRGRQVKWTAAGSEQSNNALIIALAQSTGPHKSYVAPFEDKGFKMDLMTEKDGLVTKRLWRLSIATPDGKVIKQLPVSSGLGDLARAIEDQVAQVDEFLDKYLKS